MVSLLLLIEAICVLLNFPNGSLERQATDLKMPLTGKLEGQDA